MTKDVLLPLLESEKYAGNIELLKKIILTIWLGYLRVNNLSPDKKYSLEDYLLDSESFIFDLTHLSLKKRKSFGKWLLKAHQLNRRSVSVNNVAINEDRGYTAEEALGWWGQFKSWFFDTRRDHWQLKDLSLSLEHQLTGVEICHGKKGLLISLNQFLPPLNADEKYCDPKDLQQNSTGNTKRVLINDSLVDLLQTITVNECDFKQISSSPHPYSLPVTDYAKRYKEMHEYRKAEQFTALNPWYIRFIDWIMSWFRRTSPPSLDKKNNDLDLLFSNKTISVYQRKVNQEILVIERRPKIDTIVFCGGGSKIFGHVGVYKAFYKAQIHLKRFAGSSAGAAMALLCYLGYSPREITALLKEMEPEQLINYQPSLYGLSDTTPLKNKLNSWIHKKILELSERYKFEYPEKITFATLEKIRAAYPNCGIGEELIVTATNIEKKETEYFSFTYSPDKEVSEVISASACLPFLYKPALIGKEEYNDGGLKSNLPTEVFTGRNTFIPSEHGNDLGLVVSQFNNGTERNTLDYIKEKVYEEGFFIKWLIEKISGVPIDWEGDRRKLRQHALQAIVVDIGDVSISTLKVDSETKDKMIEAGYKAAKEYIELRYEKNEKCDSNNNNSSEYEEFIYKDFANLGEFLFFCCYRENKELFDATYKYIAQSDLIGKEELLKQADLLSSLHFTKKQDRQPEHFPNLPVQLPPQIKSRIFCSIYSILNCLSFPWILDKADKVWFDKARFSTTLESSFTGLKYLEKIKGKKHILLHISMEIIKAIRHCPEERFLEALEDISSLLKKSIDFSKPAFYGNWCLKFEDSHSLIELLKHNEFKRSLQFCEDLGQLSQIKKDYKPTSFKGFIPKRALSSPREDSHPIQIQVR